MSLLIGVLTFVLVLTSIFLVLIVLMQRAKTDGGLGAAMAGGATESAFGAETNDVLAGATRKAALVFFILSFALYLLNIRQAQHQEAIEGELPKVVAPAIPAATPLESNVSPLTLPADAGITPAAPTTATPAPAQPATPPPGEPKQP